MSDYSSEADTYNEENFNNRLNLDTSVLFERGGRNSSVLDKFGLPVFDKSISEAIQNNEKNNEDEIAYLKNNLFAAAQNKDHGIEYIKEQVFLSKQLKWEPIAKDDNTANDKLNPLIVLFLFIPLIFIVISSKKRVKSNVNTHNSDIK